MPMGLAVIWTFISIILVACCICFVTCLKKISVSAKFCRQPNLFQQSSSMEPPVIWEATETQWPKHSDLNTATKTEMLKLSISINICCFWNVHKSTWIICAMNLVTFAKYQFWTLSQNPKFVPKLWPCLKSMNKVLKMKRKWMALVQHQIKNYISSIYILHLNLNFLRFHLLCAGKSKTKWPPKIWTFCHGKPNIQPWQIPSSFCKLPLTHAVHIYFCWMLPAGDLFQSPVQAAQKLSTLQQCNLLKSKSAIWSHCWGERETGKFDGSKEMCAGHFKCSFELLDLLAVCSLMIQALRHSY